MGTIFQDLKYGLRMLAKNPGFTAVAVLTIALGIGANSAIFSVVNGVLLQPLPFKDPGRLVAVFASSPSQGLQRYGMSPPDFRAVRERNHTLESFSAFYRDNFNLTRTDQPELTLATIVTAEYFTTLGVQPMLGRTFLPGEEQWGSHRVVVLSEAFWRRRFNADPDIAGKRLTLNDEQYTVVGVMRGDFYSPGNTQFWAPMAFAPNDVMNTHNNHFVQMVGRLKPGVTQQQARADLNAIMLSIAQQFPENKGIGADLDPLQETIVGNVRAALLVLLGAVVLVLLIACVNLANLLLARAAGRQKEIAIRSALGAHRRRLLRQFLTESVLLSMIGGCFGLALAWGSQGLLPLAPNSLPRISQIHLDGWVLLFTFGIAMLTGLLFGLAPGMQHSHIRLNEALKEGGRTSEAGGRSNRLRVGLVITEVGLAFVLLIGAGLTIKSFARLLHVDAGFDSSQVLTFAVNLPRSYVGTASDDLEGAPPRVARFFRELLERIDSLPGVKAAGAVSSLPLRGEVWGKHFVPLDRPLPSSIEKLDNVQYRSVAGDYFAAMGIRLVKGRLFGEADQQGAPPVVVINEALARRYWPGGDPIGKVILLNPPESLMPPGLLPAGYHIPLLTVVGVVGDAHYGRLDQGAVPVVYASYLQHNYVTGMFIAVRAHIDPKALVPSIRSELAQLDKNLPMARILTMDEIMSSSVAKPRLQTVLLGIFGALAMVLAGVGIYGVMSYSVSQRRHEIGVRMALGAERRDVLKLVVGQGMALTGVGVALGLAGAIALTRFISSLLYGVKPTDPPTFIAVSVLLTGVALLATYIPARRAAKVDPMVALRYE